MSNEQQVKDLSDFYLKTNSIHYYDKAETQSIFVRNLSDKKPENNKKKTIIIIPLDGKKAVKVLNTKLPIDLTEQAPKEDILNSQSFRDALTNGYIELVSEEEAYKILTSPEAQREKEALFKNSANTLDSLFNRKKIDVVDANVEAPHIENLDIDITVLEALSREDLPDPERYNIIKNIEDSLAKKDWEYIYEHGTEELKSLALTKMA